MLTRYLWDYATNTCLAEMDEQGETLVDYTVDPATGELISENHGGQEVFHRYDGDGNTRQTADSAGNVLGEATYSAFGETVSESGDMQTTYRFRGQRGFSTDPLTGDVYSANQNYSPTLGRRLSLARYDGNGRPRRAAHGYGEGLFWRSPVPSLPPPICAFPPWPKIDHPDIDDFSRAFCCKGVRNRMPAPLGSRRIRRLGNPPSPPFDKVPVAASPVTPSPHEGNVPLMCDALFGEFICNGLSFWRDEVDWVVFEPPWIDLIRKAGPVKSLESQVATTLENGIRGVRSPHCSFSDCTWGSKTVIFPLANPDLRLALQRATVYWQGRCNAVRRGFPGGCRVSYTCQVNYVLYDKYDFYVLPLCFLPGRSFEVWASLAAILDRALL